MKASPKTMWVDQPMYRVRIEPDRVSVMNFDITELHVQLDKYYNHVDDLPNWVKERLAIALEVSLGIVQHSPSLPHSTSGSTAED